MGAGGSVPQNANDPNARMKLQLRREAAILVEDATCTKDIQDALSAGGEKINAEELLDRIDQFAMKYKLENGFYDPEYLRALACVMRLGLTVDRQLNASRYVKEFFTDQKQIGAVSVEGVALMTGVKSARNMFVVKAPRDPKNDNLIHEYFVAAGGAFLSLDGQPRVIIGTNWFRKICLNYAQIISAFRCGAPEIDPLSKRLRGWCSVDNPLSYVSYVAYEKIDGPDMAKLAPSIDAVTFVTSMVQLAFALEIGQMYNGFTHYDLHHENVIMREMHPDDPSREVLIPFVVSEDLTYYVLSHYIPTIIDYGRCHIQTPSPAEEMQGAPTEHFGFHASFGAKYGIFADRARPYYDLFKFLGFTLHGMLENNNPVFEEVWVIMGFFGVRDRNSLAEWLNQSRNSDLFSLDQDAEKMGYCLVRQMEAGAVCLPEKASTMYDFLAYVQAQFPTIWESKVFQTIPAGFEVMKCGADCTNFEGSLMNMTGDRSSNLTSGLSAMSDLRDIMRFRNNIQQRGIYFKNNFPESQYGPRLLTEVETIDANIAGQYDTTSAPLTDQVLQLGEKVKEAYANIGYPVQYSGAPSSNYQAIAQDLQRFKGYLDRMGEFAKAYVEFQEFYETAEDMTRIAGREINPQLDEYLRTDITPLYQAYDNSRGEIRSILERTIIPREYAGYKQDLLVKTY